MKRLVPSLATGLDGFQVDCRLTVPKCAVPLLENVVLEERRSRLRLQTCDERTALQKDWTLDVDWMSLKCLSQGSMPY